MNGIICNIVNMAVPMLQKQHTRQGNELILQPLQVHKDQLFYI